MFKNLLLNFVISAQPSLIKPAPTWDITCHINSPPLIPSKYKPPFRVIISFCVDGDNTKGNIRKFKIDTLWKDISIPFEKTWRSDLYSTSNITGIHIRSIVYTVTDVNQKKVMWFDGNTSPFGRYDAIPRGVILSIKPIFLQNGQLQVSHDVEFE